MVKTKRVPNTKHVCPVCGKLSGRGTFVCVGCGPDQWVHYKCGKYTSAEVQTAVANGEQLRCNICKKVCPFICGSLWISLGYIFKLYIWGEGVSYLLYLVN